MYTFSYCIRYDTKPCDALYGVGVLEPNAEPPVDPCARTIQYKTTETYFAI